MKALRLVNNLYLSTYLLFTSWSLSGVDLGPDMSALMARHLPRSTTRLVRSLCGLFCAN
jgi:hypothetical protein